MSKTTILELKNPVRIEVRLDPKGYLFVLIDANDIHHFFLPDGSYDGWDAPGESEESKDLIERIRKSEPWVKQKKEDHPNGGSGIDDCPICGKKIKWTIVAYNGHMRAHCETEGCLQFVE